MGPLSSLNQILYDENINDLVTNSADKDANALAMQIWTDYGGTEMGDVDQNKVGTRKPSDATAMDDPDAQASAREKSDHCKWTRLPAGKTIADFTSLDSLSKMMTGEILGVVKNTAGQAAGGAGGGKGGGGGMPPGLASNLVTLSVRLARALDREGLSRQADCLDRSRTR